MIYSGIASSSASIRHQATVPIRQIMHQRQRVGMILPQFSLVQCHYLLHQPYTIPCRPVLSKKERHQRPFLHCVIIGPLIVALINRKGMRPHETPATDGNCSPLSQASIPQTRPSARPLVDSRNITRMPTFPPDTSRAQAGAMTAMVTGLG
jgi:hypothetical protein